MVFLNLDERGWLILKYIVDEPTITGKELEREFCLSRKQLGYSIDKINDFLEESEYQRIERLRTGNFRISSTVIEQFESKDIKRTKHNSYTYSEKERGYIILLLILCSKDELSTVHFTSELDISKNTLLLDLKKLQDVVSPFEVNIYYSRKEGYTLIGNECSIREILILTVRKILEMRAGREVILRIGGFKEKDIRDIMESIREIERILKIQFTDDRLNELPYIMCLVMKRLNNGHVLKELPETFQHIVGTKEYTAIVAFANRFGITEPLEKLYITAQIQISNMSSFQRGQNEIEGKMLEAARQVVRHFELICCVQIKEKEQLLEALIQHWKPAYYRIQYGYHIENSITDLILPKHNYLHEIVKKAVYPLEEMLGKKLPEEELAYFTLLFGGWLRREGLLDFVEERKRAIVICANGISVSNFLFITLRELFPEIEMLTCMSIREFQENPVLPEDYNIIFATERLDTDKIQFLVTPFLNEYSKQKFREKVSQELDGVHSQTIKITTLLDIIEQHTTIHSREQLIRSLKRYINAGNEKRREEYSEHSGGYAASDITLQELLMEETIKVLEEAKEWKEVLRLGAAPLLEKGCIEKRYLDRVIEIIEKEKPYIMVADGVVIAHAGVMDGVKSVAMSLVKLPERISVGGYLDADVVIILGTPDTTLHLRALYGLIEILEDEKKIERLHQSKTKQEIMELLKNDEK